MRLTPPSPSGSQIPSCWSGCVVLSVGTVPVVGHSGRPVPLRPTHDSPEKYGPTTVNGVVTLVTGSGLVAHTSSRPNASRVGMPAPSCRVGSGLTHMLYQAWTPGAYSSTCWVPASADLVDGFCETLVWSPSCVHVLPKSADR